MKRYFLLFFFFFFIVSSIFTVHAGQAECDPCGFCGDIKPGKWNECVQCLYNVNPELETIHTREVDGTGVFLTKPLRGHYYTQLGCIKTEVVTNPGQVFTDTNQIGGVVNYMLNKVIFPVVGALAFLYLIYGAFLLATSQDDYERKIEGQQTVKGAAFGLIFTLMSVFIVGFIAGDVLKIPGFTNNTDATNLQKIKLAIEKAGTIPGGFALTPCTEYNSEYYLETCSGESCKNPAPPSPSWPLKVFADNLLNSEGRPYVFDPDYYCRPEVNGCKEISTSPYHDDISNYRRVRAVVSTGKTGGINDYCPSGSQGGSCTRQDKDNTVLIMCEY